MIVGRSGRKRGRMFQRNDLLVGQIALQWGLITPEQLQQALTLQAGQARRRFIGEVLVDCGYLAKEQLARLVEEQQRRMQAYAAYAEARKEDLLFGRLLVRGGHVVQERVSEALGAQQDLAERGIRKRLGELLVEAGHIPFDRVLETLHLQGKTLMTCRPCGAQYNVVYTVAEGMTCRKCGRPLEPGGGSAAADETSFLLPAVPPLPPRPPTVRAAAPAAPVGARPPAVTARTRARRRRRTVWGMILLVGLLALAFLLLSRSAAW